MKHFFSQAKLFSGCFSKQNFLHQPCLQLNIFSSSFYSSFNFRFTARLIMISYSNLNRIKSEWNTEEFHVENLKNFHSKSEKTSIVEKLNLHNFPLLLHLNLEAELRVFRFFWKSKLNKAPPFSSSAHELERLLARIIEWLFNNMSKHKYYVPNKPPTTSWSS